MWALCLRPWARGWGGGSGHRAGGHPPRPPQAALRHLCRSPHPTPPPRHPAAGRASPAAFPAHTRGTARPVPQSGARRGGVVPREDGPRRSPSSATPCSRRAPPPPIPPRSSRTLRASPSRPRSYVPGGSARLGSAAAARLLGQESRGGCAGGASPEPRPGPCRAPPVRWQRPSALGAGASPRLGRASGSEGSAGAALAPPARRSPPRAYWAGRSARRRCWRACVTLRRRGVAGVRAGSRLGRSPRAASKEPRTLPFGPRLQPRRGPSPPKRGAGVTGSSRRPRRLVSQTRLFKQRSCVRARSGRGGRCRAGPPSSGALLTPGGWAGPKRGHSPGPPCRHPPVHAQQPEAGAPPGAAEAAERPAGL